MKRAIPLFGGLALAMALLALAACTPKGWPLDEIERQLVGPYCEAIAAGRYEEAHARFLAKSYRDAATPARFAAAQAATAAERGVLGAREVLRVQGSSNLFSRTRSLQILYRLEYPTGERRDYMVIDDADGQWRIEGTYVHRGGGLEFKAW